MSDRLHVVPVYSRQHGYPTSGKQELRTALLAHPSRAIARELKDARVAGSALRSLLRGLPPPATRALRRKWAGGGASGGAGAVEDVLLSVLSCDTRFAPVVDPAWTPPVDSEASWLAIAAWLDEVGYT
jgi:hypothetical protein